MRFLASSAIAAGVVVAAVSAAAPVGTPGAAFGPIALSGPHLVVVRSDGIEDPTRTIVEERNLTTGRVRVLAADVLPAYGVASTRRWAAFAVPGPKLPTLVASPHAGGRRITLGRSLVTAVAVRGERLAWGEAHGDRQRVIVRNLASGRTWTAADLPACSAGRCFRLDSVTLADAGVVFSRGAIGPQASVVFRRRYGGRLEHALVRNDPQPDLVPSFAGAAYYAYRHGWFRWDFGRVSPVPLRGAPAAPANILRVERGGLIVRTADACHPSVAELRAKPRRFASPRARSALGPACATLTGLAIDGRKMVAGWAVLPQESLQEHSDKGLVGFLRTERL
jgi:hypothetical protein